MCGMAVWCGVSVGVCDTEHMWKSEDILTELVLSCLPVSPRTIQGSRLFYSKFLDLLSHLSTGANFSSLLSGKMICLLKNCFKIILFTQKFNITLIIRKWLLCIPIFA